MAITFEQAKRQYVHRYTIEFVPAWALRVCENNGMYYAPQYRTDREWFDNTLFPPNIPWQNKRDTSCYSTNQSWPLGKWLTRPYRKQATA